MDNRRNLLLVALLLLLLGGGTGLYLYLNRDVEALPPVNPPPGPTPPDVAGTFMLTDVVPADGAVIQGTEGWVRAHASAAVKGQARWRRLGDEAFQSTPAGTGELLLAKLSDLKAGETYEFYVEASDHSGSQRTQVRKFAVKSGLAFEQADEQTVQRDYDQTVMLTLRNGTDKKVSVAARAFAVFDDLPADIVGPGSVDEPVELAPGDKLPLRLAVTAPDATRAHYEIPVEATGAFTTAKVRVHQPKLKLAFKAVSQDPRTLAQTVEITNEGETLTDLAIGIADPHAAGVRMNPSAKHALLVRGAKLSFVVAPVLYLEFTGLKAELECRAAGQTARFPLEFKAPEGKRLIGVRTGTTRGSFGNDTTCPNKPNSCTELPASGNGPAPSAGGGDVALLRSPALLAALNPIVPMRTDVAGIVPRMTAALSPRQCIAEADALAKAFNQLAEATLDLVGKEDVARKQGRIRDADALAAQIADNRRKLDCLEQEWKALNDLCDNVDGKIDHWQPKGTPGDREPDRARRCDNLDKDCYKKCYEEAVRLRREIMTAVDQELRNPTDPGPKAKLRDLRGKWEALKNGKCAECGITLPTFDQVYEKAKNTSGTNASGGNSPRSERPIESIRLLAAAGHAGCGGERAARSDRESLAALQPTFVMLKAAGFAAPAEGPTPAPGASDKRPVPPPLRTGLLDALAFRASFSRQHRGPLAGAIDGNLPDSSAAAVGWHAGDRVWFAWHDHFQVIVAAFDPTGKVIQAPQMIGTGRWPRVTADGKRTAVAWKLGDSFFARVHDGAQWGPELLLPGSEAAIAFAPDGPLHAATSSGLWKLGAERFERTQEAAFVQPALAFDGAGKPLVAWRKDGKVMVGDKAVDDGERPTLSVTPDGTVHLAYLSKGGIAIRSRTGPTWGTAEILPVKEPAWPALARDDGGVRLTYVGPAERGPAALWLVRRPAKEPVLVPSLEGNVTDVSLVVRFRLSNERWYYRPYDMLITVNGVWIDSFLDAVPEGRYLFRLDPRKVFTTSAAPVPNIVAIYTWQMNSGHYKAISDYQLITRTAWSEHFAFAADLAEVRKSADGPGVNHDQPDLVVLANSLNLPVKPPTDGRTEFVITVANVGEVASTPARLVMLHDKTPLARTSVPPLKPGEQQAVTMFLDGKVATITFKLEQDKPDFEPKNDTLDLRLWSDKAPDLTAKPTASAIEVWTDDRHLMEFRGQNGKVFTFEVTGRDRGSVWGTGLYTDDCSLGKAAVHAGMLKVGEKGLVRVRILPGHSSYQASTRNGVSSGSWGSWVGSFRFEGVPRVVPPEAVDLKTWKQQGPKSNGTWQLAADNKSVEVAVAQGPTFFVSPAAYAEATVEARIQVNTENATLRNQMGLVLGFKTPTDAKENEFEFLLLKWSNSLTVPQTDGLYLVRVKGKFDGDYTPLASAKTDPKCEVLAHQDGGWGRNGTEHLLEVRYEPKRVAVTLNGKPAFEVAGTFAPGRVGLYNFGQPQTRYSGIAIEGKPTGTGAGIPR